MSKLLEDEKVKTLVEKEVSKAVKAERQRVLTLIKSKELPEDKDQAKLLKAHNKALVESIKEAA